MESAKVEIYEKSFLTGNLRKIEDYAETMQGVVADIPGLVRI